LRKIFPPEKFALAMTWLFTTGGIVTALAAPGTMPEINSQVTTLGLGLAVTVALKSKNKAD
jgi:hypothetical protein